MDPRRSTMTRIVSLLTLLRFVITNKLTNTTTCTQQRFVKVGQKEEKVEEKEEKSQKEKDKTQEIKGKETQESERKESETQEEKGVKGKKRLIVVGVID